MSNKNYILVEDMIKELKKCNPKDVVIIQKDAEGNSYSPLSDIEIGDVYVPETTWYGERYLSELTPELLAKGYSDDDTWTDKDTCENAVYLVPIN